MEHPHQHYFDLAASAWQTMRENGFEPDFPDAAAQQIESVRRQAATATPPGEVRDLRNLLWSSIDNDTSRDLDQIEVAEKLADGRIRLRVGIADVDAAVPAGSPIDQHAGAQATTVYTGTRIFPMLPESLSTDLTSLLEGVDRLCIVIDMTITPEGVLEKPDVYPALTRNSAQLTYNGVGRWLEGTASAPPKVAASAALQQQVHWQDEAAQALRKARYEHGALDLDSVESQLIVKHGTVTGLNETRKNRASILIEDLMIAANSTIAGLLAWRKVSSIRRVVRTPARWSRIVTLAAQYGQTLPAEADSGALNAFLHQQRLTDPVHSPDLSLAVMKLLGPGEYVLDRPGDASEGHFGLAVQSYTHSTAPNRRYADLVIQRLLKAVLAGAPAPYTDDQLAAIARTCTLREDAARKVERVMAKRMAAVALSGHLGETYPAVVTGVAPKGTFVRILTPPVEGRLVQGEQGLDVGDRLEVKLVGADPARGFLDFARRTH